MVRPFLGLDSFFIGCMVAFLPLYIRFSSVDLNRVSKSNALLLIIPMLLLFFGKKVREFPRNLKIIFLVCISHLIIFQFEPASYNGIYQAICISLGIVFLVKFFETEQGSSLFLLNSMALGASIQALISISQHLGFDIYKNAIMFLNSDLKNIITNSGGNNLSSGSLLNPNLFGAYLALCMPAFFRKNFIWMLLPIVVLIVLSKSAMAIATACLIVAYYFLANTKLIDFVFYLFTPLVFVACCVSFPEMTSYRNNIWLEIFKNYDLNTFLIGGSTSWFESLHLRVGMEFIGNEHNEYISIVNIFGIFSLLAVGYLISLVINNQSKNRLFASIFFGSFVNMLGNFPLHVAPLALIVMISLAFCLKENHGSNMDR